MDMISGYAPYVALGLFILFISVLTIRNFSKNSSEELTEEDEFEQMEIDEMGTFLADELGVELEDGNDIFNDNSNVIDN